jgi:hypothetical protein
MASFNGHIEIAKFLVEHGANVNAIGMFLCRLIGTSILIWFVDENNRTALLIASLNGHAEVAELLVKHGSDVDAVGMSRFSIHFHPHRDRRQCQPNCPEFNGHIEFVKVLIEHSADVNAIGMVFC